MLSQAQRVTILELHTQGVAKREIARVLGISRVAVRQVLRSSSTAVPEMQRRRGRWLPGRIRRQRPVPFGEKRDGAL